LNLKPGNQEKEKKDTLNISVINKSLSSSKDFHLIGRETAKEENKGKAI